MRTARTALTLLLVTLGWPPLHLRSQSAGLVEGTGYTLRVEYREMDARGRATVANVLLARVRAHGDNAHYEILQGHEKFRAGDEVITTDGGRTLYALSSRTRTFREVSVAEEERDLLDRRRMRIGISHFSASFQPPRPCGRVGAFTTTCAESIHAYDIRIRYFLLWLSGNVRERFQFWMAEELPAVPNPYASFLVAMATVGMRNSPEYARRIRENSARLLTGMPVRMVITRQEGVSEKGVEKTKATTLEVSDVRRVTVESSLFEIPPGYTRQGG